MIVTADCLDHLRTLPDDSIESCVTDPPYGLGAPPPIEDVLRAWLAGEVYRPKGRGFMGKAWDAFVPGPEIWREVHRVLRPGSHLLAFFGTRTFDVGVLAIRLAGFEIRDEIAWLYGQGFPKALDVSKAIDREAGAERKIVGRGKSGGSAGMPEAARWEGWGTALKPAHEPIVVARKPFRGTVAQNVIAHGTGAYNIGACRITASREDHDRRTAWASKYHGRDYAKGSIASPTSTRGAHCTPPHDGGRWPANVVLDEEAAEALDAQSGRLASGGASRFFYCAKASAKDRGGGNDHPTVKPVSLMRWLVRLVTPPGGTVLDPFAGSGTTGVAAAAEGFGFLGIEREERFAEIARARIAGACGGVEGVLSPEACDSSDSSETE